MPDRACRTFGTQLHELKPLLRNRIASGPQWGPPATAILGRGAIAEDAARLLHRKGPVELCLGREMFRAKFYGCRRAELLGWNRRI